MKKKEKEGAEARLNEEFDNEFNLLPEPQKEPEEPEPIEQPAPSSRISHLKPISKESLRSLDKASNNLRKSYKRMTDPTKRKGRFDKPLCIAIDEDLMKKVRVIMYQESTPEYRCTLKNIVDEALEAYIKDYEEKNGIIKID